MSTVDSPRRRQSQQFGADDRRTLRPTSVARGRSERLDAMSPRGSLARNVRSAWSAGACRDSTSLRATAAPGRRRDEFGDRPAPAVGFGGEDPTLRRLDRRCREPIELRLRIGPKPAPEPRSRDSRSSSEHREPADSRQAFLHFSGPAPEGESDAPAGVDHQYLCAGSRTSYPSLRAPLQNAPIDWLHCSASRGRRATGEAVFIRIVALARRTMKT